MKCGVLFSGGKDSVYSAYLIKKKGHKISCLISIFSENKESYMFHTPSISKVKVQAEVMDTPLLIEKTKGEKEKELKDLKNAIKKAIKNYDIDAIITGAVESVYQKSRIEKICDEFDLECFNPLWKIDQIKLLDNLLANNFDIIVTGVFAYPLDKSWLERKIDNNFIKDMIQLYEKYKINPSGEGGEIESYVVNCPLFKRKIEIIDKEIFGSKNSWYLELKVK